MKKYKMIVRCQLLMRRSVTDDDRKALDCYYETPAFYTDCSDGRVKVIEKAYEQFCVGRPEFRCAESVKLVCVA